MVGMSNGIGDSSPPSCRLFESLLADLERQSDLQSVSDVVQSKFYFREVFVDGYQLNELALIRVLITEMSWFSLAARNNKDCIGEILVRLETQRCRIGHIEIEGDEAGIVAEAETRLRPIASVVEGEHLSIRDSKCCTD